MAVIGHLAMLQTLRKQQQNTRDVNRQACRATSAMALTFDGDMQEMLHASDAPLLHAIQA